MKSYKEHLVSIKSFGEKANILAKPVYRSSAIFPVYESKLIKSKVSFLGYWLKKRNIKVISILLTFRDEEGTILHRKEIKVNSVKAYSVLFSEILDLSKEDENFVFIGSLELEVFSVEDMVFPYPAFIIEYVSELGTTAVHTTGRVFNDIEDYTNNSSIQVAESGFDIFPTLNNFNPFFCFTNGPKSNLGEIELEVISINNENKKIQINIGEVKPYATKFVFINEYIDLNDLLKNSKGTVKIHHNFDSFFPRFIAGNFYSMETVSITHSYYDNLQNNSKDAYFENKLPNDLYDSSVFIPLLQDEDSYTDLVYYPIYSPSEYKIDLKFFSKEGEEIFEIKNWKNISGNQSDFFTINLNEIVKENSSNTGVEKVFGIKIINVWEDKTRIPTRLKYGLNVGLKNKKVDLPTNICFAPQISNEKLLKKTGTFKWSPILNNQDSRIVITNPSVGDNEGKNGTVNLSFYREQDEKSIERTIELAPNAQYIFELNKDTEIKEFLGKSNGWLTKQSDSQYTNAWYFDISDRGIIAGDHSF